MSRTLEELKLQVELAGHSPGTPGFARALRSLQVEKCQELRGVVTCSSCSHYEHCELVREHMRDKVGG